MLQQAGRSLAPFPRSPELDVPPTNHRPGSAALTALLVQSIPHLVPKRLRIGPVYAHGCLHAPAVNPIIGLVFTTKAES